MVKNPGKDCPWRNQQLQVLGEHKKCPTINGSVREAKRIGRTTKKKEDKLSTKSRLPRTSSGIRTRRRNNCIENTGSNKSWKFITGLRTKNRFRALSSLISIHEWKNYYHGLGNISNAPQVFTEIPAAIYSKCLNGDSDDGMEKGSGIVQLKEKRIGEGELFIYLRRVSCGYAWKIMSQNLLSTQ